MRQNAIVSTAFGPSVYRFFQGVLFRMATSYVVIFVPVAICISSLITSETLPGKKKSDLQGEIFQSNTFTLHEALTGDQSLFMLLGVRLHGAYI